MPVVTDWNDDVFADDPRPFYGERSEPVGTSATTWRRDDGHHRAGTWEQHRQWRIAEGICPRPACGTELEEGACSRCGWSLLEEQMNQRVRAKEPAPDYLPRLPGALFIDEYAQANIDEEAA